MIQAKSCPECGTTLAADALEGLCPRCLLQGGRHGSKETPIRGEAVPTSGFKGPLPALEPAALAQHFPELEILELLGQGGMGAVYKARQLKLDRLVALKVLSAEASADPAFAERFSREARALARLNHPHIVTIHDFGETDGLFYFLMEYVDGVSLRQALLDGRLDLAKTLQIIPQVCDALQYAHEEDIVHRDVKPENILLDKRGRVKIADFGLAKLVGLTPTYLTLTGSHQIMGTLYYMAPEQMQKSHTVDSRADIYSLGVVLYEMLTGELPLGRFAPPSHKARLPQQFDDVVLRALAKEPERRFQRVSELRAAVAELNPHGSAVSPSEPAKAVLAAQVISVPCSLEVFDREEGDFVNARGLVRLEDEHLVLEFMVEDALENNSKTPIREKCIPLNEIASLSLDQGWGAKLVIRATRLSVLAGIAGADQGQVKLSIAANDRPAAHELVSVFMQRRFFPGVPSAPPGRQPHEAPPNLNLELVHMDAKGPAAGLIVTAIVAALAWALLLTLIPVRFVYYGGYNRHAIMLGEDYPFLIAIVAVPVLALLFGALKLRKLQGYEFALVSAILAMVPWSPAVVIGLPMGIWALVFLNRPQTKAAFAYHLNLPGRSAEMPPFPAHLGYPEPRRGPFGAVASFFRSVGNYCFNTRMSPPPPGVNVPPAPGEQHPTGEFRTGDR